MRINSPVPELALLIEDSPFLGGSGSCCHLTYHESKITETGAASAPYPRPIIKGIGPASQLYPESIIRGTGAASHLYPEFIIGGTGAASNPYPEVSVSLMSLLKKLRFAMSM